MYTSPLVSISPSNNIEGNSCVFIPVVPGDIWLYKISRCRITDPTGSYELTDEEDDRGLYHRCIGLHGDGDDCRIFGVEYVLFSCPPYQQEAPYVSNKLIVYDVYDSKGMMMPPYVAERFVQDRKSSAIPAPRDSIRVSSLDKLYETDNPNLTWGGGEFKRPILVRSVNTGRPVYRLIDPFLQWSPPRYLFMMDELLDLPDDTENFASLLVDNFNWEYFDQVYKAGSLVPDRVDQIAAAMFDVLYDEQIYTSISKKLWVDSKMTEAEQDIRVMDRLPKSVIVNFTDIVTTLKLKIYNRLGNNLPSIQDDQQVDQIDLIPDISGILP